MCCISIIQFKQHANLQKQLIDTGDVRIVFACNSDGFLGNGCDIEKLLKAGSYPGRNTLGMSLMRLRRQLRQQVLLYQHQILLIIAVCTKIMFSSLVKKAQIVSKKFTKCKT